MLPASRDPPESGIGEGSGLLGIPDASAGETVRSPHRRGHMGLLLSLSQGVNGQSDSSWGRCFWGSPVWPERKASLEIKAAEGERVTPTRSLQE